MIKQWLSLGIRAVRHQQHALSTVTNTHKSEVDVVTVSQSVTPVTGKGAHQAKHVGGDDCEEKNAF